MSSLMNSVSGVRGIVGEGLTPEVIARYSTAFGTLCGNGKVVVGRDTRISGPMIEHAVFSGLMASGCSVFNVGISTTPTIQIAVKNLEADGGIAITASHNPAEWNALKFFDSQGMFLNEDVRLELEKYVEQGSKNSVDYDKLGSVSSVANVDDEHIKAILNAEEIKADLIRHSKFKVVVDCVNGAASKIFPLLLEELGCNVIKINCEPDGRFPRGPEPVPENLEAVCSAVKENGANLGFACDPDGDRLAVIDEYGKPIGEENSLVLSVLFVLSHNPGPVATNLSTTSAVDTIAGMFGVEVFRTKIGEIHVVQKMIDEKCVIGGEGNGGVILPGVHYGRDALAGAALILQLLSEKGETVSSVVSQLPQLHMTKVKTEIDNKPVNEIFDKLQKISIGAQIDTTDGIKLTFPSYWVHLRPSNTEPILRIMVEASTKEESKSIADRYLKQVNEM